MRRRTWCGSSWNGPRGFRIARDRGNFDEFGTAHLEGSNRPGQRDTRVVGIGRGDHSRRLDVVKGQPGDTARRCPLPHGGTRKCEQNVGFEHAAKNLGRILIREVAVATKFGNSGPALLPCIPGRRSFDWDAWGHGKVNGRNPLGCNP